MINSSFRPVKAVPVMPNGCSKTEMFGQSDYRNAKQITFHSKMNTVCGVWTSISLVTFG